MIRFTSHDRAHHPMIGAPRLVPGRGMGLATPVPAGHRRVAVRFDRDRSDGRSDSTLGKQIA